MTRSRSCATLRLPQRRVLQVSDQCFRVLSRNIVVGVKRDELGISYGTPTAADQPVLPTPLDLKNSCVELPF